MRGISRGLKPFSKAGLVMVSIFALVAQPMSAVLFAQTVSAEAPTLVATQLELKEALANPTVTNVVLTADIPTAETIVLGRSDVSIQGNDKTISFTGDTSGWQGHYVFQVYNASAISINSLRMTGGDAGLLVNGSQVTLTGHTHVTGNEFGGIEVSNGKSPKFEATLTSTNDIYNFSEINAKPTVWTDGANATFNDVNGTMLLATHVNPNQKQYYLNAANTGTVATNATQNKTYVSLQDAFDAASENDTVLLNQDVVINSKAAVINTDINFDGQKHTIKTINVRGDAGAQLNAALIISADGTEVRNLIVEGTGLTNGLSSSHGLIVYGVTGVILDSITAKNNAAGIIVNRSVVAASNITTVGNAWYGINVDETQAVLSISGTNSHSEAAAIYVDNRTVGTVIDVDSKYTKIALGVGDYYILDKTSPSVPVNGMPRDDAYKSTNDFYFTWDASSDANSVTYEFQSSTSSNVDNGSLVGSWNSIVSGNSEQNNLTTPQIHSTGALDGHYYWQVRAIDAAGNKSAWSTVRAMNIDTQAPAAPTITNSPVYVNASEPWDLATWSHNGADVNHFEYREYLSQAEADADNDGNTTSYWHPTTTASVREQVVGHSWTGVATLYYRVVAVDNAGNRSLPSDLGTVFIDKNAPNVTINDVAAGTDSTPAVTGTTSELGGSVTITLDGIVAGTTTSNAIGNWTWTATTPLMIGSHTVVATATDAAGNVSSSDTLTPQNYWKQFTVQSPVSAAVNTPAGTVTVVAQTIAPTLTTAVVTTTDGTDTLGAQDGQATANDVATIDSADDATNQVSAAGASDTKDANNGVWSILGFAWYWWLLLVAGIVALWWLIATLRLRKDEA